MRKLTLLALAGIMLCHQIATGNSSELGRGPKLSSLLDADGIVFETKQIFLERYPEAHNPSIINTDKGLLMTFRVVPDPQTLWISYIGVVLLDDSLRPISEPQLLDTRFDNTKTPSQSEDARIFAYNDRLYLLYNDNVDRVNPSTQYRRDMYLAELIETDGKYEMTPPLKLCHEEKYGGQLWQKNWVPFVWNDTLLYAYSIIPHEILYDQNQDGMCSPLYATEAQNRWSWGPLRGGTPALLVDGEYLAFFHSSVYTSSKASGGKKMWHYYMGAYTFSAEPPFEITKISQKPIVEKTFYTKSDFNKRVIFPGGFVVMEDKIYFSYGKDDTQSWIGIIDKEALKRSLVPVE